MSVAAPGTRPDTAGEDHGNGRVTPVPPRAVTTMPDWAAFVWAAFVWAAFVCADLAAPLLRTARGGVA